MWLASQGGCVGAAHVCSRPAGAVKVAAREPARDNVVLVSQRGSVWPSTGPPACLPPFVAGSELLLGDAEKTLSKTCPWDLS